MSTPTILIVGSANVDLVTRVPRCPRPGETLLGRSFSVVMGGKGANQAVAAARLGARTFFAGCVGKDAFGAMQREALTREGIDLTYLKTHPTEPTGTAVIFVADEGQNSIVVTPAANYGILPEDVAALKPLFSHIDAVLLQLEIPLETVEAVLRLASEQKVLSILDAGPAQKVPASIIAQADLISPNETEVEAITGVAVTSLDDARDAAEKLLEMGAQEVVLKLGSRGALYMGRDEWFHAPAFQIDPVDTVAAGDAFTAGLAIAWRSELYRRDAVRFANAAGAIAAMRPGAQPSMPRRAEVDELLAKQ